MHLVATRTGSKYNGTAIVDTKNILAAELKKRGLIDVAISNKGGYEHGMAQPAVLVIKKDGSILYKWSINPSYVSTSICLISLTMLWGKRALTSVCTRMKMNLGGAKDRPDPKQIWENVNAQLHEKPVAHEKLHTLGIWTGISQAVLG